MGQAKANGPTCSICINMFNYIIRSNMVKSILLICGYIRCKVETALLNADRSSMNLLAPLFHAKRPTLETLTFRRTSVRVL